MLVKNFPCNLCLLQGAPGQNCRFKIRCDHHCQGWTLQGFVLLSKCNLSTFILAGKSKGLAFSHYQRKAYKTGKASLNIPHIYEMSYQKVKMGKKQMQGGSWYGRWVPSWKLVERKAAIVFLVKVFVCLSTWSAF